jgi:hypothetical protein
MVRAFRGVACALAKGYWLRWFTLTESDEAIAAGIDFAREFKHFRDWLRKVHCPDFQFIIIEHRQGDKQRRNWHVLCYGSDKLPVLMIREYWLSHFKSTVTGMARVADPDKAVKYLAGYLADPDKFVRAWSSQGWVFRGWIGASREYHRRYGDYPLSAVLVTLSLMSPCDREYRLGFLLETGFLNEDECSLL